MSLLVDCFPPRSLQLGSFVRLFGVTFVLDQHALLDFNRASPLKQQSRSKHFAPLGHIIP